MTKIIVELLLDETNEFYRTEGDVDDPRGYILNELGWVESSGISVSQILDSEV